MATIGSLVVKVGADISGLASGMETAQRKISDLGKNMMGIGAGLSAGITVPIVAAGTAAVNASTEFNALMANVQSLGVSAERVEELKAAVQKLGPEVGKSTTDLAEGLYQVVSAFGDSADTVKILEINAKAATAGLATTTDAINLTSALTASYGDKSAEAVGKVSDLAFVTVQLGRTTFPELASSMGAVAPLANNMGVSMEELFATMATATSISSASEVVTQLRGVIQALMAPTAEMTKLMDGLGYSSGAAMIQGMGLQGTIQAIVDASAASGKPLQSYISSIEGQTLATGLATTLAGDYAMKLDAMGKAAGATETAFRAQTEGINAMGFQWQQLQVRMEVILQQLGDAMGPALMDVLALIEPMVTQVQEWAKAFAAADPEQQKMVLGLIGLAAAAGPVLLALGSVTAAIAAIANPIGLVVVAVAGLAAAWATNFLGIRDITDQVWNGLQAFFRDASEGFPMLGGAMEQWSANAQKWFEDVGAAAGDDLAGAIDEAFNNIATYLGTLKSTWDNIFKGLVEAVQPVMDAVDGLKKGIEDFKSWIGGISIANPFAGIQLPSFPWQQPGGYATGTDYYPGGIGLVGEQGPELVQLPRGSKIFPADMTEAMLAGAGGVTINANVASNVDIEHLALRVAEALRRRGR